MISTTELRRGNLVHPISTSTDIHLPATGIFLRVVEVGEDSVKTILHDQETISVMKYDEYGCKKISPIPLTPEILKKCGFIETEIEGEYINCQRGILFFTFDRLGLPTYRIGELNFTTVHYLHQLQNLYLDLTCQELPIKDGQLL